jgi:hypothetical protein
MIGKLQNMFSPGTSAQESGRALLSLDKHYNSVMTNGIIQQVGLYIREMFRLCRVLNVEGRELRELNDFVE